MSSTVGSATRTGWKRRASAASFSMCLRYSSSVVAPMTCSSPRASAGLSMLPASIAALAAAAPAPTRVCSSSMKTISSSPVRPDLVDDLASAAPRSRRGSGCRRPGRPGRAGRPACRAASAARRRRTMRWARPSTMAVLPTPASPISTGLFLVRRDRISTVCSISSARPITGSIWPLPGQVGQVRAVLVQGGRAAGAGRRPRSPARPLGVWPPAATRGGIRPAASIRPAGDSGFSGQRHQDVLGADVVGARSRGTAGGRPAAPAWPPGSATAFGGTSPARRAVAAPAERVEQGVRVGAGPADQVAQRFALQRRPEQVVGVQVAAAAAAAARRAASASISRASALISRVMSTRCARPAPSLAPAEVAGQESSHGSEPKSPGPIMSVLRSRARHGRQGLPGGAPRQTPQVAERRHSGSGVGPGPAVGGRLTGWTRPRC